MDKEKIRILHLRSSDQTANILFGAETILLNLCRGINGERFDTVIAALKDRRAKGELPLVEYAKRNQIKTEVVSLDHRFDLRAVARIRELLAKYQPHIVHCHDYKSNIFGLLAVKRNKTVKLITTAHGWAASSFKVKFYELIDAWTMRNFDKVVAVSESIGEMLSRRHFDKSKVCVISNGIDLEDYTSAGRNDAVRQNFNLPPKAFLLGTVGRLSAEKGQKYLIEAFACLRKKYDSMYLLIVGDGVLRDKLKQYARKKGIDEQCVFTGFREDAREIISVLDIFVLPSLTEGTPVALLEAMALSVPVVASNVGGVPAVVKDGMTGLIVKPKDTPALVRAVENLFNDRQKRIEFGAAAAQWVKRNFSVETMVHKYESFYREIAG